MSIVLFLWKYFFCVRDRINTAISLLESRSGRAILSLVSMGSQIRQKAFIDYSDSIMCAMVLYEDGELYGVW